MYKSIFKRINITDNSTMHNRQLLLTFLVIFLILCLLVYTAEVTHRDNLFFIFSVSAILKIFIVVNTLKYLPYIYSYHLC